MDLILTRTLYAPNYTLGFLYADDLKLATVERPQIHNPKGPGGMPRVSCIDEGDYTVKPWDSDKFPGTYMLVNMIRGVYPQPSDIPAGQAWGRSAILIHAANEASELLGCVAVGMEHDGDGVAKSRAALGQLRLALGREINHRLTISRHVP